MNKFWFVFKWAVIGAALGPYYTTYGVLRILDRMGMTEEGKQLWCQ